MRSGRISATAGDVLIHPELDCHGNRWVSAGVKLIRLHWTDTTGLGAFYRWDGIDDLAVANRRSNNVSILLGDGIGTSCPTATEIGAP